ncbi:MAG: hypothetical protein HY736_21650, partial [Verrucomicrobia bacterium]|nr:hypothetical protein [Verrucomicrobiota bacterium]
DPAARSDLLQLRALCEAVDSDAFAPISAEEVSDQRTPAFILQLSSIVQASVDLAVTEGALDLTGMKPQANANRIGRYAYLGIGRHVGLWFGIHFGLWKAHGRTPLWAVFSPTSFGRSCEVRGLLEPWVAKNRVFAASENDDFVVAIDMPLGEEKHTVVRANVDRLKEIVDVLSVLKSKPTGSLDNE